MEKMLAGLKEKLQAAAGENLRAMVLYGSGARGEYRERHSDLNVLCLFGRLAAEDLQALHPAASWWQKKGFPTPQLFTLDELRASADIFAIELLDMKTHHRMIYGEDFFNELEVPMQLHKLQVERELRTGLVKLRQAILLAPQKDRVLLALMDASASSFVTLFRHALVALGEDVPPAKREVVERMAQFAGASAEAFCSILDSREGKIKAGELNVKKTLHGFLDLIERVNEEVDRKL